MSDQEKKENFIDDDRDKNLRDVIVHLVHWQELLLVWLRANQAGEKRNFLPDGYNWKTYPQMNIEVRNRNEKTGLEDSLDKLGRNHRRLMKKIEGFNEEELFTKKYYSWTGTTNLASYIISSTSSHYDWAIKKIRKNLRIYRKK